MHASRTRRARRARTAGSSCAARWHLRLKCSAVSGCVSAHGSVAAWAAWCTTFGPSFSQTRWSHAGHCAAGRDRGGRCAYRRRDAARPPSPPRRARRRVTRPTARGARRRAATTGRPGRQPARCGPRRSGTWAAGRRATPPGVTARRIAGRGIAQAAVPERADHTARRRGDADDARRRRGASVHFVHALWPAEHRTPPRPWRRASSAGNGARPPRASARRARAARPDAERS